MHGKSTTHATPSGRPNRPSRLAQLPPIAAPTRAARDRATRPFNLDPANGRVVTRASKVITSRSPLVIVCDHSANQELVTGELGRRNRPIDDGWRGDWVVKAAAMTTGWRGWGR